ncbi:MAG: DUF2723 domain-containing protein [Armatimonadota bacterium]
MNNNTGNKTLYFKIIAVFSFLLPLIVYIFTLCPTTYSEDCGEFITGAYKLGVLHPPGYPLYSMLGKVFTFIPVGSIAWRVNFMSAFWAALAGLFLFLLIYRLTKKIEVSFASAMLFCFSPAFWSQSIVAEVYTLNIFFLSVCMYLLQIWRESDKNKYLYLFAFMYGLSLTNHHFMTLAAPFFIIFIIWTKWQVLKDLKLVLGCIGLFIAGLLPYLYLPIASKFNPVIDWGNPETLGRFLDHIQRKTYGDVALGRFGIDVKWMFIKGFLLEFLGQFGIVFIVIGMLGFIKMAFKDIKFTFMTFGIFIFNSILLIFIQEHPYSILRERTMTVYYFPCYLVFACYIGYGLSYIWNLLAKVIDKNKVFKVVVSVVVLLIAVIPIWHNYHQNNLSNNYFVYDYVKSSMDLMDRDAIIFAKGDAPVFSMFYLKYCENHRPDITIYENTGAITGEYLGEDMLFGALTELQQEERRRQVAEKIIDENYGKRPVYFNYDFYLGASSKYRLVPFGTVFKVVRKDEKVVDSFDPLTKIHIRNLYDDKMYKDYDTKRMYALYWDMMAFYYLRVGDKKKAEECYKQIYKYEDYCSLNNAAAFYINNQNPAEAVKYVDKGLSIDQTYFPLYFNKALVYELEGDSKGALKYYVLSLDKYKGDARYAKYVKLGKKRIKQISDEIKKTKKPDGK